MISIVLILAISIAAYFGFRYLSSAGEVPFDVTVRDVTLREFNKQWEDETDSKGAGITPAPSVFSSENLPITVTREWLSANLYKVRSYAETQEGKYLVELLDIQEPEPDTWEELKVRFMDTKYSVENHYSLQDGVNCQGMVCYLAGWCEENSVPFAVDYAKRHVAIRIMHEDTWYRFNFTEHPSIVTIT